MRKYIVIVMAMLCLCFVGCRSGEGVGNDPGDGTVSVSAETSMPAEAVTTDNAVHTESETAFLTDDKGEVIVLPDQTFETDETSTNGDAGETLETETETDKVEKSEKVTEKTTAVTTVTEPLIKPLPNGGVELPDDIW